MICRNTILLTSGCLLLAINSIAPAAQEITLAGLFRDKALVEIDGKRRILKQGETSVEGITLLSTGDDWAVLDVGGVEKTYRLESRFGGDYTTATDKIVVTIAPDGRNMYFVSGSINGFQVKFVVDTGATLISMNRNVARRIGLQYRLEGRKSRSDTASGVTDVYIIHLDQVRVGDIVLDDVEAAVHDGDFPLVTLLGNSFLSRVNMKRNGRLMQLSR